MDTRIEFQKITGGKLLVLFGRYILSQQNNAQIFQKLFLKGWILKKEFFLGSFWIALQSKLHH